MTCVDYVWKVLKQQAGTKMDNLWLYPLHTSVMCIAYDSGGVIVYVALFRQTNTSSVSLEIIFLLLGPYRQLGCRIKTFQ